MKTKKLMTLAAVLCCAMTSTVFTACGDDVEVVTTYQYEIQKDPSSVCNATEAKQVLKAFETAIGTDGTIIKFYNSNQDKEMKAKCEAVRSQYASQVQSAYMKFNLIRIKSTAIDKPEIIATYEMGLALDKAYVYYALSTNHDDAYAALEAKKATLNEAVYNATKKTLKALVGQHLKNGGYSYNAYSTFETYFGDVFNDPWPDAVENTKYIQHKADSLANVHIADTLAVDVTVTISKADIFDSKYIKIWEKQFPANF